MDRLPSWGHYKADMSMDADYARYLCDIEDARAQDLAARIEADPDLVAMAEAIDAMPSMSPLYYDDSIARLDLIIDRLELLRGAVIATGSEDGNSPSFVPMQRPVTAIDIEREKRARNVLLDIEAEIFGQGLNPEV